MRRSGKTTRRIDEAVQELFSKGAVIIPKKHCDYNMIKHLIATNIEYSVITDPDYMLGVAQLKFEKSFMRRLFLEHGKDSFEIDERTNYTVIKIKTPCTS